MHVILYLLLVSIVSAQNDTFFQSGEQWHLEKIQAQAAWDYSKGEGVVVAVLDTGVNYNHPELRGQVLVKEGYDFVNNDSDAMDDNGHGTAISAILAAKTNNRSALSSIGWKVKILPVKVMSDSMRSHDSQITKGIYHAVKKGARIISISISSPTKSLSIEKAINHAWSKGCVIISSGGNTGQKEVRYPAALKNVIGVGVTDNMDQQPSWSTYGKHVDISAPGRRLKTISGSEYKHKSGSSYATPLVSGTAALLAALPYKLTNQEIVDYIKNSAEDLGDPGYDIVYGHGRLNAGKALKLAMRAQGVTSTIEEATSLEAYPLPEPEQEVNALHDSVQFSIQQLIEHSVTLRVKVPLGVPYKIMGSDGSPVWFPVYTGRGNDVFETFTVSIPKGYTLFELEY